MTSLLITTYIQASSLFAVLQLIPLLILQHIFNPLMYVVTKSTPFCKYLSSKKAQTNKLIMISFSKFDLIDLGSLTKIPSVKSSPSLQQQLECYEKCVFLTGKSINIDETTLAIGNQGKSSNILFLTHHIVFKKSFPNHAFNAFVCTKTSKKSPCFHS